MTREEQVQMLIDRAEVEDLLSDYAIALDARKADDYAATFADDAVLDINGEITEGRAAIRKRISDLFTGGNSPMRGNAHMLLTNVRITVKGNSGTVTGVWTGITSENVKAIPKFVEQGRYDDEVIKQNGRWYFKRRAVTSDGGMPDAFDRFYKPR
ncbi:MAG TPA: nuclear transport factor 2 family protein [Alphaproteobacteria bacterium]|nr:nuclear transport factor 2 family protein [Alphaproteobacteria bacterium]